MIKRFIMRLFRITVPTPPVVKYCKNDGSELKIEQQVLEYSQYTGKPSVFKTVKSCPKCNKVVDDPITAPIA